MKGEEYLEFTAEELIKSIRKCPVKYLGELPEQLKKWAEHQTGKKENNPTESKIDYEKLRMEIASGVIIKTADARVTAELAADYALEVADQLIKKLKDE